MAKLSKEYTEQGMQNETYDKDYGVLKRGIYGWDGSGYIALKVNSNGALDVIGERHADFFTANITSADATTAVQVKAKTASKNIYITSFIISVDTEMNVKLQDDAGTPVVSVGPLYITANSGIAKNIDPIAPIKIATNQDLDVLASAAGNITVFVAGYVE